MIKVLLIEDDTTLRENTAELLELSGYQVHTAGDGDTGVKLAKSKNPDIIVCDIMMLGMDGYEVLKTLGKDPKCAAIPFIFLSARGDRQDIRKGMNLGADDYITKPFQLQELTEAIENRIRRKEILKTIKPQKSSQTGLSKAEEEESITDLEGLRMYFLQHGDELEFKEGTEIYSEGKHSNFVYMLNKGIVKTHRLDHSGKDLITTVCQTGSFFGYTAFISSKPYRESAECISDCILYALSKDTVTELLLHHQHLTLALVDHLAEDLAVFKERLLEMAYGSVRQKTAHSLLEFVDKGESPHCEIHISRSDLASVAGITQESLIRTLSDFKKEGLIDSKGRSIRILREDLLRKI